MSQSGISSLETAARDKIAGSDIGADFPSRKTAWRAVLILTLLYCLATVDRQIVSILVTPIKASLALSDIQIGLVQGAFSIFFTLASLPIGWLIDRARRKIIILVGTLVWSVAAVATGFVSSFGQFFAARAAIGAGEATLQPTAFTIMADLFPAGRLALPLSLFVIGSNVGNGMSYILGGVVLDWLSVGGSSALPVIGSLEPWKQVFVLMGLPGFVLAFAAIGVADSRRSTSGAERSVSTDWRAFGRHYGRNIRFYLAHHLGFTLCIGFVIGLLAWNPAYLNRRFGWDLATIGVYLGSTQILTAIVGLSFHGWLIDRLHRAGFRQIHLRYFVLMCPLAGGLAAIAYSLNDPWQMIACFNLAYFCIMGYPGIGAASLQIATPARTRGRASAVYLISLNMIGAFGGPMVVALLTDRWFADEQRLGDSLAIFSIITMAMAAAVFLVGAGASRPREPEVGIGQS